MTTPKEAIERDTERLNQALANLGRLLAEAAPEAAIQAARDDIQRLERDIGRWQRYLADLESEPFQAYRRLVQDLPPGTNILRLLLEQIRYQLGGNN